MNFLYMAYGVAIVLCMLLCMFILTMLGNFIFNKDQLNSIITPLFFLGLVMVGFFKTKKAPENKYINSALLSLILVSMMGVFIYISGFIPKGFHLFIVASLLSLQMGSLVFWIVTTFFAKKIKAPDME